jgi:hypothetical protein
LAWVSAGLLQGLVHQVFEIGPALFETGGVHVGQVVGNNIHVQLLAEPFRLQR